jgi:ketosteroid isomerase-like protein
VDDQGNAERDVILRHDQRFFEALTTADADVLAGLLAEEFLLVAVANGDVVRRAALLDAVSTGAVRFLHIKAFPDEAVVRRVGDVAIVVGRTSMTFASDGPAFTTSSRYTHVFQATAGGWELLSAQGTAITSSVA